MQKGSNVSITNKTRAKIPGLPFVKAAKDALGTRYELSVAFVQPADARRIARTYKRKDYAANVLSFRLTGTSGEMIICPATAKKQAPDFGRTYPAHLLALFIHGALHLKGLAHGGTMEREERRLLRKYISQ
jgi:probable rRNA maturation factor